jgi:prevent-host-death family protein
MAWQIQEAKAKFSELIRTAQTDGPQTITNHGQEEAVVMSKKDYDRLKGPRENLVDFYRRSPLYGVDLKIERNKSVSRRIDL